LENPTSPLGKAYQHWLETKGAFAAFDLSVAIIRTLHNLLPNSTPFILNSSTGKDSTITTQVVLQALREELQAKKAWTRPITVAIADTASEFPEMRKRMYAEAAALNNLGEKNNLPLSARIVAPPVKNRLLVELCGNGKPVPAVNKTGKAQGVSSWCMDRVKAGSLKEISRQMASEHGSYLQILGVRNAESVKRKDTISKYSNNLPLGLSRIDTGKRKNKKPVYALSIIPIVHWSNEDVSNIIRNLPPLWRPESREELRAIYLKGSPLEGDANFSPTECSVTISDEGTVSNSCSDLSGTRYGCWHCFLSQNKSLRNTARRDPRYTWLRAFHKYVYRKGKQAIARSEMLKKAGFTKENSFTKTFTFLERYKMLMLLYRAQIESGFSLLLPEEEAQIQKFWEKHGIFAVTPQDALADAHTWKKTGKWKAFFEDIADEAHRLCESLSEGIPYGAIFGLQSSENQTDPPQKKARTLELSHLLAMTGQGFGTPLYPKRLAYLFSDNQLGKGSQKIIVVITDTPTLLGLPTQTGLLNTMSATTWQCLGMRDPLPWELQLAQDRNWTYEVNLEVPKQKNTLRTCPQPQYLEWHYQLHNRRYLGCADDDPLTTAWFDQQLYNMTSPLSQEDIKFIFNLTEELTRISETLTDHFALARQTCLQKIAPFYPQFLQQGKEGLNARSHVRTLVSKHLHIPEVIPLLHTYASLIKTSAQLLKQNKLNTSIILELVYIHNLLAVDPKEGELRLQDFLRKLNHQPAALAA
jgi:DNA sulfur modification protein DndC